MSILPLDAGCAFIRQLMAKSGNASSNHYLLHIPQQNTTWVGAFPNRIVKYSNQGFDIQASGQHTNLPPAPNPFPVLRNLLDPSLPCFFMISLDLQRSAFDPALPLLLFIQPGAEVKFHGKPSGSTAEITAASPEFAASAKELLDRHAGHSASLSHEEQQERVPLPWHTEKDGLFLKRLEDAVRVLRSRPGKMIVSRTYRKPVRPYANPFRLFEIYSRSEPSAAACHFLALDETTYSLGCSPENVFELDHGKLIFDVIAATRGRSTDPEKDQRWFHELQHDAKERTEHLMAFNRYRKRLDNLCQPGTAKVDQSMGVRTLKRVRHLHSRLSGRLRSDLDLIDLLEESFPPLSSYPDELIPLADPGLEPTRFYGGIVGRAGPGWNEISCFLNLRSALLQNQTLYTQGGVGVISESKPRQEMLEVANKLSSLLEAVITWESEVPDVN
jgi:anthranilate/para-aminobenzoate synthase component I